MMDCTDNPEAFYEYLISSGYNKKYEIIWLVSEKRKFRNQNTRNVKFVTAENKYGWSSPLAYYYGATAGFFFYSHNSAGLNRYRCKGQTVVNLWHGCGYKDAEQGKKKQNIKPDFDYALVPVCSDGKGKKLFCGCRLSEKVIWEGVRKMKLSFPVSFRQYRI